MGACERLHDGGHVLHCPVHGECASVNEHDDGARVRRVHGADEGLLAVGQTEAVVAVVSVVHLVLVGVGQPDVDDGDVGAARVGGGGVDHLGARGRGPGAAPDGARHAPHGRVGEGLAVPVAGAVVEDARPALRERVQRARDEAFGAIAVVVGEQRACGAPGTNTQHVRSATKTTR